MNAVRLDSFRISRAYDGEDEVLVKGTLGHFSLQFWGRMAIFYGGSYQDKPDGMFGVRLECNIRKPSDIDLCTPDFGVPEFYRTQYVIARVIAYINQFAREFPTIIPKIYVGCTGGIGRTGTFLALMIKLSEEIAIIKSSIQDNGYRLFRVDPIEEVRSLYYSRAVETREQKEFVYAFPMRILANASRIL